MAILVTGGAGFIGSHTTVQLLNANHDVVILDNLSNSSAEVLQRIKQITGKEVQFYQGDVRDRLLLQQIFAQHQIEHVLHFAGLKAVGESVREPLKYYDNNVSGSLILVEEMANAGVFNLVFSSSPQFMAPQLLYPLVKQPLPAVPPILMVHLNIWWNGC